MRLDRGERAPCILRQLRWKISLKKRRLMPEGYTTSYLEEVVWYGCNGVWPRIITKDEGDRHVDFHYDEFPEELHAKFNGSDSSARAVDARKVIDVYCRTRRITHQAKRTLDLEEERIRVEAGQKGEPVPSPILLTPINFRIPYVG